MRTLLLILTLFFIDKLFCQTMLPFQYKDKCYYVDDSLRPVSTKTYSFIFPFKGSRAIIRKGNKYGVIDKKENTIIPCEHDTIMYGLDNFLCLDDKVQTWKDINGKTYERNVGVCGGSYASACMFNTYKKKNKIGLLIWDDKLKKLDTLPNIYSNVIEFNTNVGAAKLGNKWGVINSTGKIITSFTLDSIAIANYSFRSPYILHKYFLNNSVGFLNANGEIVTKAKYKDSYFNMEQFTLIKTETGKLCYIDYTGREYFK